MGRGRPADAREADVRPGVLDAAGE